MATSHRRETLDAHMADSNWKKWICMIPSICKKYLKAKVAFADSQEVFADLTSVTDVMLIAEWTLQEEAAFAGRDSHPERLDIYDVAKAKSEQRHSDSLPSVDHVAVPGRAAYQLNLTELEKENRQDLLRGTAAWLSTGLKIQEAQQDITDGSKDARRWLEARIAKFHQDAVTYVGEIEDPGEWQDLPADVHLDPVSDSEDDAGKPEVAQDVVGETVVTEKMSLSLPSTFSPAKCMEKGLERMAKQELELRKGQANDALHHIWIALGHKFFLFQNSVRQAKSQRKKTQAWNEVTALEGNVREYARIYSACRLTMLHLEADDDILTMYKELDPEHLKARRPSPTPASRGTGR
ncbi:hypothetical protein EW146_g9755 [Bondarzewia mesenterica]|uniref:Uncharacterized protein n=1 Tax=Bondarzewia mesenterica TaxID=1095465 RepID=A0A4S4L3V5_9AGAM|nr:hypothetical protein EW146_g9755 [Bondarzewia mesenterica]